jgi:hypothetical protein
MRRVNIRKNENKEKNRKANEVVLKRKKTKQDLL